MTTVQSESPANPVATAEVAAERHANHVALLRDYGILAVIFVLGLALSLTTDTFLTGANLNNLLDQIVVVGILACGATLCIICGVFDLSASAILALSAVFGVLATQSFGVGPGFVIAVAVGALLGLFNGLLVTGIGVHSFIATLASSMVFRGCAILVTGGAIVYPHTGQIDAFRILNAQVQPIGLTLATCLFLGVVAATWFLLAFTSFGRCLYAVGGNPEAARLSGISVTRVKVFALVISGVCASLAGLVLASRAGSAQPSMGTGLELTAIAATVVGGTSIMGGEGAIWRAVAGVTILQLFSNGFNLLGWDTTYQQVLTGALILLAVTVDTILKRQRR
jgi:ribose transport system permease protein